MQTEIVLEDCPHCGGEAKFAGLADWPHVRDKGATVEAWNRRVDASALIIWVTTINSTKLPVLCR